MQRIQACVGAIVGAALLVLCASAYANQGHGFGGGRGAGAHAVSGRGAYASHGGAWGGWHGRGGWYGRGGWVYGCCGWWGLGFYDPFWDPYLWYGYWPMGYPYPYVAPLAEGFEQYVPPPPTYWYYCPDSHTYYRYVRTCASAWQQVEVKPAR